ncbi:hypothetical protein OHA40_08560 [Nocardia sp. NBC_00508]|uniref:hypothetical protein n=1 Tax=Nocardia sp. NBC_00508 TaxID=2975992 RepID=UPI002E8001D2|nr:hypothetical protein [Nocardia sp. NBC_00508]WUD68155.1 hypothetical protein OHA40_08560 [Nocardia sp. NBC_00508]
MSQVIKVFTPIKRVPTMIGKAQNGQKLPFGPYTLPQVATGVVLMLVTSVCAMTFPVNPAVTFIAGLALTIMAVFAIGLVPYTGVRMTSRAMWLGRLIVYRKPVSASGMPISSESVRHMMFIEETVVLLLPDRPGAAAAAETKPDRRLLEAVGAGGTGADLWQRMSGTDNGDGPASGGRP